jgi:hypothetical protein
MASRTVVTVTSVPAQEASIEYLSTELHEVLSTYVNCTPANRDRLMAQHGQTLIRLDQLLHVLTRSDIERETRLTFLQVMGLNKDMG